MRSSISQQLGVLFALPATLMVAGLVSIALAPPVAAYIPAVAINETTGLNLSEGSRITIRWGNPAGEYGFGV